MHKNYIKSTNAHRIKSTKRQCQTENVKKQHSMLQVVTSGETPTSTKVAFKKISIP